MARGQPDTASNCPLPQWPGTLSPASRGEGKCENQVIRQMSPGLGMGAKDLGLCLPEAQPIAFFLPLLLHRLILISAVTCWGEALSTLEAVAGVPVAGHGDAGSTEPDVVGGRQSDKSFPGSSAGWAKGQ